MTKKANEGTPDTAVKSEARGVYKFTSENKYLTCAALGVQFMDGKAQTESLEVAKALVKISGVTMIED